MEVEGFVPGVWSATAWRTTRLTGVHATSQYDIPVLDLNGKVVMKHRVDLKELERLVREASEQPEQQSGPGDKPASEDT